MLSRNQFININSFRFDVPIFIAISHVSLPPASGGIRLRICESSDLQIRLFLFHNKNILYLLVFSLLLLFIYVFKMLRKKPFFARRPSAYIYTYTRTRFIEHLFHRIYLPNALSIISLFPCFVLFLSFSYH